jgi:hypothetical protein
LQQAGEIGMGFDQREVGPLDAAREQRLRENPGAGPQLDDRTRIPPDLGRDQLSQRAARRKDCSNLLWRPEPSPRERENVGS